MILKIGRNITFYLKTAWKPLSTAPLAAAAYFALL